MINYINRFKIKWKYKKGLQNKKLVIAPKIVMYSKYNTVYYMNSAAINYVDYFKKWITAK